MSNWVELRLSEITEINPHEVLKKGVDAKKVPMDKLQPHYRDIPGFIIEPYSGGAKFRNGDTIMARITPCLENGKIAQVNILDENEVGFGSTEYIVFRAKDGIDPDFIYYLVSSSLVKEPAIKSMVGSSGRQRVQTDVVQNLLLKVPELKTQRVISSTLKVLDDKIAENNRINHNLQQQAAAMFKEWFIDNSDSSSWQKGTFSDLIKKTISGDWGKDTPSGNNTEMVYCIRGADIPEVRAGNKGKMPIRYIPPKNFTAKRLVDGDIVVEISGGSPTQSTGRAAVVSDSLLARYDKGMVCTNFCKALKPIAGFSMYVFHYWQYLYNLGVFFSYENGTTGIKNLDINGFLETESINIAPVKLIEKFNTFCQSVNAKVYANGLENERLAEIRDMILPKLMSGEISVSEIEV